MRQAGGFDAVQGELGKGEVERAAHRLGLGHELRDQAPRYAKVLPELPRLLHAYLQQQQGAGARAEIRELLAEQKRTNQMLRGLIFAGGGFILGLIVMQVLLRVRWLI